MLKIEHLSKLINECTRFLDKNNNNNILKSILLTCISQFENGIMIKFHQNITNMNNKRSCQNYYTENYKTLLRKVKI